MFELVEARPRMTSEAVELEPFVGIPANNTWRNKMKPVIGLDVAKGFSVLQAFVSRNQPFGKAKRIAHSKDGYETLEGILDELRDRTGEEIVIVMEATGHYHRGIQAHLERQGYSVIVVNPLQSKRSKSTHLRKVKTDAIDAWHLAEMYYRDEVTPHRKWEEDILELQHLTRQHEFVTGMFVQAKLNARALVDQVFPDFTTVFRYLFSKTGIYVLKQCLENPPDSIEDLKAWVGEGANKSHSKAWIERKSVLILQSISSSNLKNKSIAQTVSLCAMLSIVSQLQEQLELLEEEIELAASALPEVDLLKTMPGVGDKLAAAILSEVGDVKQFQSPKQLVAYAGLDPGVFSSGKFVSSRNHITKRGSKRLRRAIYLAVQCGLRGSNAVLKEFYSKKRGEGKPYKVVIIACANKLLHHIYAMLTRGESYKFS